MSGGAQTVDFDLPAGSELVEVYPSSTGQGRHVVYRQDGETLCTCEGFRFRNTCKHVKTTALERMTVAEFVRMLEAIGYKVAIVPARKGKP